jgi:DNA mismatch repair protein MutS2
MKRLVEAEGELPLEGTHPIAHAVGKARVEGALLEARDLLHIGQTLAAARAVKSAIQKVKADHPLVWEEADRIAVDRVLEFNITQAVDENGGIRDSASRELQAIRRSIADRSESVRRRLQAILRSVSEQGYAQDEVVTTREGRHVIPVKAEHKNRVPGFMHSASSSGATVFIEPAETLELNNEIRNLYFEEQREVARILRDLTGQVRAAAEHLLATIQALGEIDALHARARYSIEILGQEPTVSSEAVLRIAQARHPVLLLHHGRAGTIPLDFEIGSAYRTLIISGPNAGGKSVTLKCVGLLALMVQSGLHVPVAPESVFPVFSSIFVDIGDEQSIESDLSTFSSHLDRLRSVLASAGPGALVLLDEIGSGTDPVEGSAIAAAVLEHLTHSGALTIATTHQGSLKAFAYATEGMENGAMEFNQESLQPTYRFRAGVPGSSYAFALAARHGIPDAVLARARELVGPQQTSLDRLVLDLEESARRSARELEVAHARKVEADALAAQYRERVDRLSRELGEMKRKAVDEAERIVAGANAAIERAVREIREQKAGKNVVQAARAAVESLREEIRESKTQLPPPAVTAVPLGPGSLVTVAGAGGIGELEAVSPDGTSATVLLGSLRLRIPVAELRPAERPEGPRRAAAAGPHFERDEPVSRELDVRGMTGDEALPLVDKFIDDAVLAGLFRVDIIHGKGTGALRKKVADFLSRHPRVRSFHLGEWNEGSTGATVVELNET